MTDKNFAISSGEDDLFAHAVLEVLDALESLPANDAGERTIPPGGLDEARKLMTSIRAIIGDGEVDVDAATGTADDKLPGTADDYAAVLKDLDQGVRDCKEGRTLPLPSIEAGSEEEALWSEIKAFRTHMVELTSGLTSLIVNWSSVPFGEGDASHARMCAMAQAKQLVDGQLLAAWRNQQELARLYRKVLDNPSS